MRRRMLALTTAVLAAVGLVATGAAPPAHAAEERIAGADRYSTSALISRADPTPTGGTVFLASGQVYSDALAAAPVAAAERGRLLLTDPLRIPQPIVDEIRRLAPREIVVVGGPATIGADVEDEARALAPLVTRIGGADRVEVSMALLDRRAAPRDPASGWTPVSRIWVVSGGGFSDALSAASVAARLGHGLVITTGLGGGFLERLQQRLAGVQQLSIAGGPASVPIPVEDALRSTGLEVERFGGADRYAVSVAINQRFTASATGSRMLLASGEVFTDGLSGAVLAGALRVPMYLTPRSCAPNAQVRTEATRLGIRTTTVLGGVHTVSPVAAALVQCSELSATADEMLRLLNAERRAAGVGPLRLDGCLMGMARGWADEMARQGLSGSAHNPDLTAEARACRLLGWGENVGRTGGTRPDVPRMVDVWMNSEGHRNNILRASSTELGVGVARGANGSWYYVLDFGRR